MPRPHYPQDVEGGARALAPPLRFLPRPRGSHGLFRLLRTQALFSQGGHCSGQLWTQGWLTEISSRMDGRWAEVLSENWGAWLSAVVGISECC